MTRKTLNKTPTATPIRFGGEDTDYINKLLTGTDQTSTDPVDINTQWTHRSGKLKLAGANYNGTTDTYGYNIIASAIAANRNLTLPLLTGNDTLLTENFQQTLQNTTIDSNNNTFQNTYLYPDKKTTSWYVAGATGVYNVGPMQFTIIAGTTSSVINSVTDGRYITYTTGTNSGDDGGLKTTNSSMLVRRYLEPYLKIKFRLNSAYPTSNIRFMCGYANQLTPGGTNNDDPFNAITAIGVGCISTDTQFKILHNDTTGVTQFDNTGINLDTNPHVIEIQAPPGDTKFQWKLDGAGSWTDVTTDIPISSSSLHRQVWIETATTAAKAIDFWYCIESVKVP